jgi:hypothetical protein
MWLSYVWCFLIGLSLGAVVGWILGNRSAERLIKDVQKMKAWTLSRWAFKPELEVHLLSKAKTHRQVAKESRDAGLLATEAFNSGAAFACNEIVDEYLKTSAEV